MKPAARWQAICPACKAAIGKLAWPGARMVCAVCRESYAADAGIYRLLTGARARYFAPFLEDYTRVRRAEGRGSDAADYYRLLPDSDGSEPLAWQWRIRAVSYRCLRDRILARSGGGLKIVDLGAGVGWLCNRLDALGHHPVAVDLSVDRLDGLCASRHYPGAWPRIQAEFDNLPLAGGQANLVIFNASLHYSCDYASTLGESLRVLAGDGSLIIMDTPVYRSARSGERMKAERHAQFERDFGVRSDAINSLEYLTWDMLAGLGRELELEWSIIRPWYGWRRALRPIQAVLRREREPSRFAVIVGSRRGRAVR